MVQTTRPSGTPLLMAREAASGSPGIAGPTDQGIVSDQVVKLVVSHSRITNSDSDHDRCPPRASGGDLMGGQIGSALWQDKDRGQVGDLRLMA